MNATPPLADDPGEVVAQIEHALSSVHEDDEPKIRVIVEDEAGDRFGLPPAPGWRVVLVVVVVEPGATRGEVLNT